MRERVVDHHPVDETVWLVEAKQVRVHQLTFVVRSLVEPHQVHAGQNLLHARIELTHNQLVDARIACVDFNQYDILITLDSKLAEQALVRLGLPHNC